jgi:hypothetical protein
MGQGINQQASEILQFRRAKEMALKAGRPERDAYLYMSLLEDPIAQQEGKSKLLEAMQNDPVAATEMQLKTATAHAFRNVNPFQLKRIMGLSDPKLRQAEFIRVFRTVAVDPASGQIVDPIFHGMTGGDPQALAAIAATAAKQIPVGGDISDLKLAAHQAQPMRAQHRMVLATEAENIIGLRDMENRSMFERAINTFNTPGGIERGIVGATLQSILPEYGNLDEEAFNSLSPALKKQAAQIMGASLSEGERSTANSLLGMSKFLTGGADIFEMMKTGTPAEKSVEYMSNLYHRFENANEEAGDKLLAGMDANTRESLKQTIRGASEGLDFTTLQKIKGLAKTDDLDSIANILAASGMSKQGMHRANQLVNVVRAFQTDPEAMNDIRLKMKAAEGKVSLQDLEDNMKSVSVEYTKIRKQERDEAVKNLSEYTGAMKENLGIGIGKQIQADTKVDPQALKDKASRVRDMVRGLLPKGASDAEVDALVKQMGNQGSVADVIDFVSKKIGGNTGLNAKQVRYLQEALPDIAQYAISQTPGTKAHEEAYAKYPEAARKAKASAQDAYDALQESLKAYDITKGLGDDDAAKAERELTYKGVKDAQAEFEAQRAKFAPYGTPEELAKFTNTGPGPMDELLRMLSDFFTEATRFMRNGGGNGNGAAAAAADTQRTAQVGHNA